MIDLVDTGLLVTIVVLLADLERRVGRLEAIVKNYINGKNTNT